MWNQIPRCNPKDRYNYHQRGIVSRIGYGKVQVYKYWLSQQSVAYLSYAFDNIDSYVKETHTTMRKHIVRSVIALGLMIGLVAAVSAQSLPGSGWFTSVTIQNVGTGETTVNLTAYNSNPSDTTQYTGSANVGAGANAIFLPGQTGTGFISLGQPLPSGFSGSMVVSAGAPIVAISQIGNNQVGTNGLANGFASGQYRGASQAAASISFPTVKNGLGNKVTIFSIQAVGGSVNYSATIRANNGATHTRTGEIQENRAVLLDPGQFTPAMAGTNCGSDINVSPCLGSLTVSVTGGTGQLVGAVVETQTTPTPANIAQAATMFTPSDGDDKVFCPVIKNRHTTANRNSGVVVQNVGAANTRVRLSVAINGGGTATSELDIPAGASRTFVGGPTSNLNMPENTFGAGTVEVIGAATQIIAAVNEANFEAPASQQKATTYTCFAESGATSTAAFPLVKEVFGNPRSTASVNLQVVEGTTVISAQYVCPGESPITLKTASLSAGQGQTFFTTAEIPDNKTCAVTATADTSGARIIGFSQETSTFGSFNNALDIKNYEGFNQ